MHIPEKTLNSDDLMQAQVNKFPIRTRRLLRQKLDKHKKLQKFSTSLYLKYCKLSGFAHVLPDFLIIGFPKCGTTSLYEYLIQHPDIYPPIGKEIDYFDRLYSRKNNWYKVKFPTAFQKNFIEKILKRHFLTGEATPRYIFHPHAIHRIKKTIPNSKFIVLLRNPIERAFSHYNMNVKNGYEYQSFENAVKNEQKRIQGRYEKMSNDPNFYSWDYDLFAYLEQGIYVEKLKRWMHVFPKEQFLIIQSEEFLENPPKIYYKALQFLNLGKWEPKSFTLYKKRQITDNKVNPELRKYLSDFFKPYNEDLFNLLGKKFDWN